MRKNFGELLSGVNIPEMSFNQLQVKLHDKNRHEILPLSSRYWHPCE
jgi:hypothetical protein